MDNQKVFLTLLGMSVVTFLPRLVPAWLLSSRELPSWLTLFLRFVPTAVLATLLWPSLLVQGGQLEPANLNMYVAIPTGIVAFVTRSFLGTVILGVGLMALARYLM